MPTAYKHGTYGENEASNYSGLTSQGTVPTYIGTLPIHRINADGAEGFDYAKYINQPLLISSHREIKNLGIYSDDWESFTLCEPLRAHFMNGDEVIAPVILINMLDPEKDVAAETKTETVALTKEGKTHVGYIEDPLCNLDTLAVTVADTEFAPGEITTAYENDRVVVTITKEGFTGASAQAVYTPIKFSAAEVSEADFEAALEAVDYIEPVTTHITNILCAPQLSEKPGLHDLMIQKVMDKAMQKWNLISVSDIPSNTEDLKTFDGALAWKKTNQYNAKLDKVIYPCAGGGNYIYRGSTIAAYMMQKTDFENDDTPYVSASNKVIPFIDRICYADGTTVFIKEYEANDLNKKGITTFNFAKQTFRLWGSHMSNYDFDKLTSINPEDRFDVSVRMSAYILNHLMYNYLDQIDESFSSKEIDGLQNGVQTWLDSLVSDGKLLYATIVFDKTANTDEELMNGDILFDLEVTYPISAKSITFRLQYNKIGLTTLFGQQE